MRNWNVTKKTKVNFLPKDNDLQGTSVTYLQDEKLLIEDFDRHIGHDAHVIALIECPPVTRRARPDATLVTVNVFVIDVPGLDQRLHEHFGHVQRDNLKKNANLRAEMNGNLRQPISRKSGKNGRIFFKQTAHSNRRPWTTVHIWTKFFRRTVVQVRRFERFALIQAASPLIGQRVISHHISSSFTLR